MDLIVGFVMGVIAMAIVSSYFIKDVTARLFTKVVERGSFDWEGRRYTVRELP